jgi:hypothetical protein
MVVRHSSTKNFFFRRQPFLSVIVYIYAEGLSYKKWGFFPFGLPAQ